MPYCFQVGSKLLGSATNSEIDSVGAFLRLFNSCLSRRRLALFCAVEVASSLSYKALAVHSCMKSKLQRCECREILPVLEPVLQSSTKQWGLHFALNLAAVHWCWVTAHLYAEHIPTGVSAGKHCLFWSLFCRAALNNGDCILPFTLLQCTGAGSVHTCMKNKLHTCTAVEHCLSWSLFCRAAMNSGDCIWP